VGAVCADLSLTQLYYLPFPGALGGGSDPVDGGVGEE